MSPSTRSAGKPKAPMRSDERMTSWVTLSSARPRKPLTSPGAAQRSGNLLAAGDAAGGGAGEELPRLTPDAQREVGTPRQLAPTGGDLPVVELHHRARLLGETQARGVGHALLRRLVVEYGLDARMLALGVGVEEHLEPPRDLVVRATGEHVVRV